MKPGWLKRLLNWMRGVEEERAPRPYSQAGWVRGADGIYRSGESVIFRSGRKWIRRDPAFAGVTPGWASMDEVYPTLHAAIAKEKQDAPLLENSGENGQEDSNG